MLFSVSRQSRALCALTTTIALLLGSSWASARDTDYGGYRPHYQGYGVNTPGGRGGTVHKVTHLRDTVDPNSPNWNGSLRKALTATGPRFVVFEVSGTINLVTNLVVTAPNLTIAGQTAPSPGITLRGGHLQIDAPNVVVQHIRVRVGNVPNMPHGIWMRNNAHNVVLDHVSVSWAVWTAIAAFSGAAGAPVGDVTVIDSVISESLACSGVNTSVYCDPATFPSGSSGYANSRAMLAGDGWHGHAPMRVAFVRNVLAHNNDRNPAIQGGVHAFIVNNLIYNPSQTPQSGLFISDGYKRGPSLTVAAGNLMIAGPTTPGFNGYTAMRHAEEGEVMMVRTDFSTSPGTQVYLNGNYYDRHCGGTACLASPSAQWSLAKDMASWIGVNVRTATPPLSLNNLPLSSVMSYSNVESYLKANAGARPKDRDVVDQRIMHEITTRTGSVPNHTSQKAGAGTGADGFPVLAENYRPLTIPDNPNAVVDSVGRTRIESWLEAMAREVETGATQLRPSTPQLRMIP